MILKDMWRHLPDENDEARCECGSDVTEIFFLVLGWRLYGGGLDLEAVRYGL